MQRWKPIGLGLLLAVLSACTPMVYGVPQESWEGMSEPQRAETMRLYQERQLARQQAQAEQEARQALERERQRAHEEEQARQRRVRVEAIHRGEGAYGDLLRVRLQGGALRLAGKHRAFLPVAFKIAAGETLQLPVTDAKGRKASLQVAFDGGTLVLDGAGAGSARAARIVYDRQWGGGKSYPGVGSKGPLELRGIEVYVEVAGRPPTVVIQPPAAGGPERGQRLPRQGGERPRGEEHGRGAAAGQPLPRPEPPPAGVAVPPRPADPGRQEPAAAARVKIVFRKLESGRGRPQPVVPATLVLADGQTRSVTVRGADGERSLPVGYRDGTVLLGEGPQAARLAVERGGRKGRTQRVEIGGARPLQAELEVTVVQE
jgi:hypothetical protein